MTNLYQRVAWDATGRGGRRAFAITSCCACADARCYVPLSDRRRLFLSSSEDHASTDPRECLPALVGLDKPRLCCSACLLTCVLPWRTSRCSETMWSETVWANRSTSLDLGVCSASGTDVPPLCFLVNFLFDELARELPASSAVWAVSGPRFLARQIAGLNSAFFLRLRFAGGCRGAGSPVRFGRKGDEPSGIARGLGDVARGH